jgi:hypothetical protein
LSLTGLKPVPWWDESQNGCEEESPQLQILYKPGESTLLMDLQTATLGKLVM